MYTDKQKQTELATEKHNWYSKQRPASSNNGIGVLERKKRKKSEGVILDKQKTNGIVPQIRPKTAKVSGNLM